MALKFSFTTPIYLKFFNPDWISPDSLVEMAHIGEEVGFDEIAVYDHFLEPPEWQPSYATNSYDPMPLLGFLAAHTERIGIASATINIPYRNPAVMANELATIDKLSGGRLCIGLAAGYLHEEYDTLGLDFNKRGAIADEYLAAMIELWTNEYASFSGEHVSFNEVKLASFPVQKPHPEVWIHGGNLRALRRAIRYGTGWGPIVGPGISTDAGSTDFKIGSTDEGAAADPYAELVQALGQEHPGIHVPHSKDYAWMAEVLEREREAIEARDEPLGIWLTARISKDTLDDAPRLIEEQLALGATKLSIGINAESLEDHNATLRAIGEQVLPAFR